MTILTGDFADAAAISSRHRGGLPPAAAVAIPATGALSAGPDIAGQCGVLPDDARLYLRHVEGRETIRALARETGCHASTILRRIRRFENRRDDPLVDRGVERSGHEGMGLADHAELRRVLRRLAEPGAVLVVAEAMEKAIIIRADIRTAVLDRRVAELLALRGWVAMVGQGRVTRHAITAAGRAALKAMAIGGSAGLPTPSDFDDAMPIAPRPAGMAEAAASFDTPMSGPRPGPDLGPEAGRAHRILEDRVLDDPECRGPRRMRVNIAESPLHLMARRRDANGQPFLESGMVTAGERLREDFELAQMGVRVTQNWDGFMTAGIDAGHVPGAGGGRSDAARRRVAEALRDLGPGMGDLVLRVCCFLEGIEMTERRLGWSARSGKVVLRLALMRLERHYRERYGRGGPLIG